jgi:hypothetical protein
MEPHFLAPDVYWCKTSDAIVFLDLTRDRYVGLASSELPVLSAIVSGWPAAQSWESLKDGVESARLTATLDSLLSSGLLTPRPSPRMHLSPTAIELVSTLLPDTDFDHRPMLHINHVLNFAQALTWAALSLKCRPIHRIVERVRVRKEMAVATWAAWGGASRCAGVHSVHGMTLEPVRSLTMIYKVLRIFSFTAKDACLLDSLTLIEFLARYHVFPDWVFGVQTGPFAAHSWVQQGRYVLNSSVECVRAYTPILAV